MRSRVWMEEEEGPPVAEGCVWIREACEGGGGGKGGEVVSGGDAAGS